MSAPKTIGFAYAGVVVPALMVYANCATLLQNLATLDGHQLPRLSTISEFVRSVSETIAKEYLSSSLGNDGEFEIAVFGWCPVLNAFQVYHVHPKFVDERFSMLVKQVETPKETEPFSMGSGKDRFLEKLASIISLGDKHGRTSRLPKLTIEAMISDDNGDVGGSMSIGRSDKLSLYPLSWTTPVVHGQPLAKATFNGLTVGPQPIVLDDYFVSMMSLV